MILRLLIIGFIVAPLMIFKKCYTSYDQVNLIKNYVLIIVLELLSNIQSTKTITFLPKVIIQNISSPLRLVIQDQSF